VGATAPYKRGMQGPRRQQIIDIAPGARYEAKGFFPSDAISDGRIEGKFHKD